MKEITIHFLTLKGSPRFEIKTEEGDITPFVYELFTKFEHTTNQNDHSIILKPIQKNSQEIRDALQGLIKKYAERMPAINQVRKIFKLIDENEYFYMVVLKRELTLEETYKCFSVLMKLNLQNFDLDKNIKQGEELFKNIWNNYDIYITREETRMIVGEKERTKRVCRFCKRSMATGASFRKEAHAISEALGNKNAILAEECDECNEYFGKTIEQDLLTYLSLYRTFFGILNKDNKIPTIKGKNFEYRNLGDKNIVLSIIDDGTNDVDQNQTLPYDNLLLKFNEKITKQNIYKVLVKFALSIIDSSKIDTFSNTIAWISENANFKASLPKIGLLSAYQLFKGKPLLSVYLRKTDNKNIPFAVGEFRFTFLTFVFIIPLFSKEENDFINEDEFMKFWKFFRHYDLSKDYRFESFEDAINREVQFSLTFEQRENE
jgi:hypothetical protein